MDGPGGANRLAAAMRRREGLEKIPRLVTTAVVLDARQQVGKGKPMTAGQLVTREDIEARQRQCGRWRWVGRGGNMPAPDGFDGGHGVCP